MIHYLNTSTREFPDLVLDVCEAGWLYIWKKTLRLKWFSLFKRLINQPSQVFLKSNNARQFLHRLGLGFVNIITVYKKHCLWNVLIIIASKCLCVRACVFAFWGLVCLFVREFENSHNFSIKEACRDHCEPVPSSTSTRVGDAQKN